MAFHNTKKNNGYHSLFIKLHCFDMFRGHFFGHDVLRIRYGQITLFTTTFKTVFKNNKNNRIPVVFESLSCKSQFKFTSFQRRRSLRQAAAAAAFTEYFSVTAITCAITRRALH